MNTSKFSGIRKFLSLLGIVSILSSLLIVPTAAAYSGDDAPYGQTETDLLIELGARDPDLGASFGSPVTRAAASLMLTTLFASDVDPADVEDPDFADWTDGQWWSDSVKVAASLGMFAGSVGPDGNTYFKPADYITREQYAVVVWSM